MNLHKFYVIAFFCFSVTMAQGYNPCEDKRFLELKSKSLDDMSDREYQYFNERHYCHILQYRNTFSVYSNTGR